MVARASSGPAPAPPVSAVARALHRRRAAPSWRARRRVEGDGLRLKAPRLPQCPPRVSRVSGPGLPSALRRAAGSASVATCPPGRAARAGPGSRNPPCTPWASGSRQRPLRSLSPPSRCCHAPCRATRPLSVPHARSLPAGACVAATWCAGAWCADELRRRTAAWRAAGHASGSSAHSLQQDLDRAARRTNRRKPSTKGGGRGGFRSCPPTFRTDPANCAA